MLEGRRRSKWAYFSNDELALIHSWSLTAALNLKEHFGYKDYSMQLSILSAIRLRKKQGMMK